MERENFYVLLELTVDPPENDPEVIKAAIKTKRSEWSKLRNHPTKGPEAQLHLDLIKDIEQVMQDDDLRQQEAQAARKIIQQQQAEQYKKLDNDIQLLSLKGKIFEKEIAGLQKKFSNIPESEIRKRIKVPITKAQQVKARITLDATTVKTISEALKIVKQSSLYEFLSLAPTSSLKTLLERAKSLESDIRKIGKKDAIVTAKQVLAGQCLSIFKTEEQKNAYDTSLARERLTELDGDLETAGMDGEVSAQEYDLLVKKAVEWGLRKEEADEHIKDYCKKRKWAIQVPSTLAVDELKQCGVCGVFNPAGAVNCSDCRAPLEVECPKCKKRNPSTNRSCTQCGFPIGDMPNALDLIRQAKLAMGRNELDTAIRLFKEAEIYWPDNAEVVQFLQKLQKQKAEIEKFARQLIDEINQRLYYQARATLVKLRQLDANHPALARKETIEQRIALAEKLVRQAKSTTNEDEVIDAYTAAIAECKDCAEAVEAMEKLPPSPPKDMQTGVSSCSISLNWTRSSSKGAISYRIVRKEKSQPVNSSDGDILAEETTQTVYDDPITEPGQIYYYGVYAIRAMVVSQEGAVVGPVMRLGEVENLQVKATDSRITLDWKPPKRAKAIEVWRQIGRLPTKPSDGIKLSGVRLDGLTDSKLENGTFYGYLICTIFGDERGKDRFSDGQTCQASPMEPPSPVEDLAVKKIKGTIELTWTPPEKGSLQLFHSKQPFSSSAGAIISVSQLADIGSPIPIQRAGYTQFPANFQGLIHIIPFTVKGDTAVVGQSQQIASIDDVENLRGSISYGNIYLEWDWHQGAMTVVVAYRSDTYPVAHNDPKAVIKTFTKRQYERESGFVVKNPEAQDYYFTVFVVADEDVNKIYSAGQQCSLSNAEAQEIHYEVKISKSIFGKTSAELILWSSDGNVNMPEAVLVKRVGNLPHEKSAGTVICTVPQGTEIGKRPVKFEIPIQELKKKGYAKLFLVDGGLAKQFRLLSPKEKLQLF